MVDIGNRDRRIEVLMRQETRSAAGGVTVSYVPRCKVWAAVVGMSGRERFAAGQNIAVWDLKVSMLFNPRIERTDKLLYRGQRYDIVLLNEVGRREGLEILAVRDLK